MLKFKKNSYSNNNQLLTELPFYGIGGSIYRIEEAEEAYYKVLYNHDGSINSNKIPVPKKKNKNLQFLLKDYFEDLNKYLELFQNQYLDYENSSNKVTLTNKQFILLAIITLLASIFSIPFLFTTTYIGLLFSTISVLSLYIVCDIHKKDINRNKERNNFMKQYKELERDLANYRSGKSILKENNKTIYTEIKEVDKSNLKILPKIKTLTKDIVREIA